MGCKQITPFKCVVNLIIRWWLHISFNGWFVVGVSGCAMKRRFVGLKLSRCLWLVRFDCASTARENKGLFYIR